jgi:hypothetical protein
LDKLAKELIKDRDGEERRAGLKIESSVPGAAHEHRIARILSAELRFTAVAQDLPGHAAATGTWIVFPKKAAHFTDYF